MKDGFIAVIDSGVGGIFVLKELVRALPNECFLYYGDNNNVPYGNKRKDQLLSLVLNIVNNVSRYPLKAIVLACNTLSLSVLYQIESIVPCKVFGVFPPLEESVMKGQRTLLIATERTASFFNQNKCCDVVGLKTLAHHIEQNVFNLNHIDISQCFRAENCNGLFIEKKGYYDNVILGCTHYELIKNKILDHFCPQRITSGTFFTVKKVFEFVKSEKSLVNYKQNQILFVGDCCEKNKKVFVLSGQK
jgi:glutamate racemase